ncbi:MAG: serine hydrolase domain-containing protein, partial [Longimicrobiales bacterium]
EGYSYKAGRFESEPFELITGAAPAGSISASATDMATFMIAHLNLGGVGEQRILSEATAVQMQTRGFEHDPRLPGWALGFYEKSSHGMRIIGHGGDTRWFHSDLVLIPDEQLGVFISYNTDKGGGLSGPFVTAFLDHYYAAAPAVVTLPDDAVERAAHVAGAYQANRMSYTTWQKAAGLMGALEVSAAEDGSLLLSASDDPVRLVPVGPLLYREELGHSLLAFEEDENGAVTHAFLGEAPMMALVRLPWYQSPTLHKFLLGAALLVFAATIIAAVRRFVRRRFGQPWLEDPLRGRAFIIGIALLNIAFVVAIVALSADFWALVSGPATGLKLALLLPILAGLLTIGALIMAFRNWRDRTGTRGARLRYNTVVVAAIVFMWSLNMWNLLGWRM